MRPLGGSVSGKQIDAQLEGDPQRTPRIWVADLRISPGGKLLLMTERTSSYCANALKVEQRNDRQTPKVGYSMKPVADEADIKTRFPSVCRTAIHLRR